MNAICPISSQPCTVESTGSDGHLYHSMVGGGSYFVTGSAEQEIRNAGKAFPRIARWVYEQNLSGVDSPELTTYNWRKLSARRELSATEKVRELLRFIRDFEGEFSAGLFVGGFDSEDKEALVFAACDIPFDDSVFYDVRKNAVEAGYLDNDDNGITFQAHQYLESYDSEQVGSTQAFVAMWFDPGLSKTLFSEIIEPAVYRAGYTAFRIDKKEHANRIDDEIVGEIRRSRFIVADFTCPKHEIDGRDILEHRGGVYYEAGLAHGLGLPVIWTCKSELIKDIHFDTRQYNHILWDMDELEKFGTKLERRIRAVVGQGPLTVT